MTNFYKRDPEKADSLLWGWRKLRVLGAFKEVGFDINNHFRYRAGWDVDSAWDEAAYCLDRYAPSGDHFYE